MRKLNSNIRASLPAAMLVTGACGALLFSPFVSSLGAQDQRITTDRAASERAAMERLRQQLDGARIRTPFGDDVFSTLRAGTLLGGNRAVIGVTTAASGKDKADTAGVLVENVTAGSPADKAGIKAGSRITSVNGVNLKVSAADADDPELQGIGQRRLLRELGKAHVGDEVDVRVATGSTSQSFKIKTVSPDDLAPQRTLAAGSYPRVALEKRASIGASIGSTGSLRDTLGIFISGVTNGGPAEKAGVIEGDRIAAINGVDVRVPREDAEDAQAAMARYNRFMRELQKVTPGEKVTLRVYGGGRYREVPLTTGTSSETVRGFQFNSGDGAGVMSLPRMNMREMTVPGMAIPPGMPLELENLPMMIRGRLNGDSDRVIIRRRGDGSDGEPVVIRRSGPATNGRVYRKVEPIKVRSSAS